MFCGSTTQKAAFALTAGVEVAAERCSESDVWHLCRRVGGFLRGEDRQCANSSCQALSLLCVVSRWHGCRVNAGCGFGDANREQSHPQRREQCIRQQSRRSSALAWREGRPDVCGRWAQLPGASASGWGTGAAEITHEGGCCFSGLLEHSPYPGRRL